MRQEAENERVVRHMDEMHGPQSTADDYADKALMSPENLMISMEYQQYDNDHSLICSGDRSIPVFRSDELGFQCSVVSHESTSINVQNQREGDDQDEQASSLIKAKIASHPCYPKLFDAYIDCQKVH
ncbi:hypothetical protein DH2020_026843 [Rehmannia glutinosa]|uniref:KNOX1 domain-containing protein n=1 Tax=Rehmannia glutinosa TaxID=99300 RepID=A0ABR0VVS8_REHGL